MNIFKYKALLLALLVGLSTITMAKSTAKELDHDANMAINQFIDETPGGDPFLVNAKAFLVFPDVKEGGFFIGGKYAEGVLRHKRKTLGYYEMMTASVGFQMGIQEYSLIIAFTTDAALEKFLKNEDDDEWETDVDGKIVAAEWNSKEELDDVEFDDDIVAFVFDSKGFMGSFTMEGTKFKKINPR
jgi:lipid-binding SYLF domain-containing protein